MFSVATLTVNEAWTVVLLLSQAQTCQVVLPVHLPTSSICIKVYMTFEKRECFHSYWIRICIVIKMARPSTTDYRFLCELQTDNLSQKYKNCFCNFQGHCASVKTKQEKLWRSACYFQIEEHGCPWPWMIADLHIRRKKVIFYHFLQHCLYYIEATLT